MGGKKEMIKQGQSSKKKNDGSHFLDGERTRSRKNVFALKNSDKQVKRKMQRILDGGLDGIEDDDLYE